jgi:serine/threonine protein kinase
LLKEEIKSYNYKIDIYSFGINMFEIFFRKPPFKYIYSYNYDEITEYFIYLKEKKDKEFYNNIFKQMIEELHFEKDSKYYSTLNEIKDLIILCTEYEYEKRPSFEFIIQRLNILINGSYTKIDDLNLVKDEYFTDLYEKIVSEGIFDS